MDTCVSYLGVVMWVSIWPYDIIDRTPLWEKRGGQWSVEEMLEQECAISAHDRQFCLGCSSSTFSAWDTHRLFHLSSYWQDKLKDKFQPFRAEKKSFSLVALMDLQRQIFFQEYWQSLLVPGQFFILSPNLSVIEYLTKVKIWWHWFKKKKNSRTEEVHLF